MFDLMKIYADKMVFFIFQVSCSNDKFMVQLELPGFLPDDFSLKTKDDIILLEAVHEGSGDGATSR